MKRFFLLIIFFCTVFITQAQYIDSLKQALSQNSQDTNRVFTFLRLSNAYLDFERDTAMGYAQEGLNLAEKIKFNKGKAQALNLIGVILEGISDYTKSCGYLLEALTIAEEIKDEKLIGAIYNNLARVSTERLDFKTALDYLFKAKTLFERQHNKEYLSYALLNIGDNYGRMEKLDSALFFQNQAYHLVIATEYRNRGTIFGNLGSIHFKLGKYDSSIYFFRLAIQELKSSEVYEALAGTLDEMSTYFEQYRKYDSSLYYARQSYLLSKQINDSKRILKASEQLSSLYEKLKIFDSAYKYSKIANKTRELILSADKVAQLENMKVAELIRQNEIAREKRKQQEDRENNLQLIVIALFIITFFSILIIISRRKAHPKAVKYLGLLGLLLLFEFIAVFIHPLIAEWTHHKPIYMLIILVALGAILVPLHHRLEKWVKHRLVRVFEKHHTDNPSTSKKENKE